LKVVVHTRNVPAVATREPRHGAPHLGRITHTFKAPYVIPIAAAYLGREP
jgi:hypothetical protein